MGAPPETVAEAIEGFECLHRVAQSYLGPLWIAADERDGGALRLVRRLQLPSGVSDEGRHAIVALGESALALEHPNVLRVLTVVDRGELLAMAYEHAEAEPLRSLQSWANLRGLSFPVGVALRIVVDLLAGVAATHELENVPPGLSVAGGLSPDSVLVGRDGSTKLCDPLIASGAALLDAIGSNTAKLAYAAPEQVHAVQPPTARADVFTCAAMLWELLASRRLLAGSRPALERKLLEHNLPSLRSSLRGPQQVTDTLIELVERALSADPAARPASAAELARELSRAGHELAPLEDVAAFVGKLSGPRFDRRTAALRTRGAPLSEETKLSLGQPRSTTSPEASRSGFSPAERSRPQAPAREPSRPDASRPSLPRPARAPASDPDPPRTASDIPETERSAGPPASSFRAWIPKERAGAAGPPAASVPSASAEAFAPAPVEPPSLGLSAAAAPSGNGALWDTMVTQTTPQQSTPAPLAVSSRTMRGLGAPAHPALAQSEPFANITPPPFAAARAEAPEAPAPGAPAAGEEAAGARRTPAEAELSAAGAEPAHAWDAGAAAAAAEVGSASMPPAIAAAPRLSDPFLPSSPPAGGAMPFEHLLPRSKHPRRPRSGEPSSHSWFELQAPVAAGRAPGHESFWSRHKLRLGAGAAALGLLLGGAWFLLARREAPDTVASPEPAPPAEAASAPAPEAPAAAASPAPPSPAPAAAEPDAGAPQREATPPGEPASAARAADFAAAKLDDSQLVVLFALEQRASLPSCSERLADTASKYSGKDTRRARLSIKAARRELAQGDVASAHEHACRAVAHNPRHAPAQRNLAELALQLGDTAQAKAALDKALAISPKDKGLLALRGDVLALMGDLAASRSAWLRTAAVRGNKARRTKRLVSAYEKLGNKALAASNWFQAATYFRRAVVLTHGKVAQSLGLSEALLGLDHARAALVWAERAAQASPKDSRVQVLFGDALYENGQGQKARAAWQAALDAQPSNRVAARRLREGKP